MAFFVQGEFFKEYSNAVAVIIHTDRISVFGIRKEKGKNEIWGEAHEMIEGNFTAEGAAEKIAFHSHKTLERFVATAKEKPTHMFFALSSAVCRIGYVAAKAVREDHEKKITPSELALLIKKSYGEYPQDSVFRNIPQRFLVDGFLVPDPVGMNGKEIFVGMIMLSCPRDIEQALEALASSYGMRYAGMTSLALTCAQACAVRSNDGDALVISVFEEEIELALVRKGAVAHSSSLHTGYGILKKAVSFAQGVGEEEARQLLGAFREDKLPRETGVIFTGILQKHASDMVNEITRIIATLDKDNLLPGTVFIACATDFPELIAGFKDFSWAASLPIDRAITIKDFMKDKHDGEAFDRALVEFLIS